MRRAAALPALLCIIATAGCDRLSAGFADAPGPVIIDPAAGQTGAARTPDGLTVFFEARGAGATLTRAKTAGDETVWISQDLASLTERRGVVTAVQGMASDLVSIEAVLPEAWKDGAVPAVYRHFSDARGEWVRAYMCEVTPSRGVSVRLDGRAIPAWETHVACSNAEQSFENIYWRDGTGRMIQSRQWLGDQLGYANLKHAPQGTPPQADAPGDDP